MPRLFSILFLTTSYFFSIAFHPEAQPSDELIRFELPWTSPFHVDREYPHHFVNAEKQHLFFVNKTAWAYFSCKNPHAVLKRAKEQGVNVLRVALEGTPYYDVLHIDMWPWGGTRQEPRWDEWNETYWRQVEERIRMAGEQGIGFDLVLYFTLHPKSDDIEIQTLYWKKVIHHLGKYANLFTWEIMNEHVENEKFQDAAGEFFTRNDPCRRPVCSSDGTTDDALWPYKRWMNLAIVHTCTGSTPSYDLEDWYLSVARNARAYGKPSFNNESGREKRHKNDDGVHRRKQGWLWCTAGGYWTWHSWDGCEGIDEATYLAPGAEFVKPMVDFYHTIPFWRMNPNHTACSIERDDLVSTTLAEPDRHTTITYCCTKKTGDSVSNAKATIRLPSGEYTITFLKPENGSIIESISLESKGLHQIQEISLPGFIDDILLRIENKAVKERMLIPGTK